MAEAQPEISVKCPCCDYETNIESQLLSHVKQHRFELGYKIPCMVCLKNFKTIELYKKHRKICNPKDVLGIVEKKPEKKSEQDLSIWQCTNCPLKIATKSELSSEDFDDISDHLKFHSRKKETVACPLCISKTFDLYTSFNRHINVHKRKKNFVSKPNENEISAEDLIVDYQEELVPEIEPDANENAVINVDNLIDLPIAQEVPKVDINALHSAIEKAEASFALKVSSKNLLARHVVDDIFLFCSQIHSMKMEVITNELKEQFPDNNTVKIQDVNETIKLLDHVTGLGNELTTHYRRDKMLKQKYDFIEPVRIPIGKIEEDERFYYNLPVSKTVARLLRDNSVRSQVIHQPVFGNPNNPRKVYKSFCDGKIIRGMDINGPYILGTVYLDAFGLDTIQDFLREFCMKPQISKIFKGL